MSTFSLEKWKLEKDVNWAEQQRGRKLSEALREHGIDHPWRGGVDTQHIREGNAELEQLLAACTPTASKPNPIGNVADAPTHPSTSACAFAGLVNQQIAAGKTKADAIRFCVGAFTKEYLQARQSNQLGNL